MRRWVVAILAATAVALFPAAHGKEPITARTFRLAPGASSPPATIGDMRWLAGHWRGEALGGTVEEIWSAPEAGAMMGMYRLVKDGKTVFYELITLTEERGSLMLRLKHFHPDLKGWEEKDRTVDFPLVARERGAYHFNGMSLHPDGDTLVVHLAIDQKNGSNREETFTYRRVR